MALYKTLLENRYDEKLFALEMFSEYVQEFEKLTETKNRKKQRYYKALSSEAKAQKEEKELLNYVRLIEEDKLYYFCLAQLNPKEVIIVKAPSDGAKNKKFLGYEWSGRKGDEGIKYITSGRVVKLEEGAEALENILNLGNIQTPLYNPSDKKDETKINTLIAKNFGDEVVEIPEELEAFVSKARLVDMMDFSRKEFSKAISLSPKKKIKIESKWDLVKLGDISKIESGGTPKSTIPEYWNGNISWVTLVDTKNKYLLNTKRKISQNGLKNSSAKILPVNTVLFSSRATIGEVSISKIEIATNQGYKNFICNSKKIEYEFLYEVLKFYKSYFIDLATGTTFKEISKENITNFKIPLPPLKIQKEIIKKCELVDNEVAKANGEIEKLQKEIEFEIDAISGEMVKLENLTLKIGSGSTPKGGESSYKESGISLIRSQNIYDDGFHKKGLAFIDEKQAEKLNIVTVEENDILFNITGASVARCCLVESIYLPARVNQHVAIIRPNDKIEAKYLQKILTSSKIKKQLIKMAKQSSTREAITKNQLQEFKVPVVDLDTQKEIVKKIEILETKITKAKNIIDGASERKENILKEYLS